MKVIRMLLQGRISMIRLLKANHNDNLAFDREFCDQIRVARTLRILMLVFTRSHHKKVEVANKILIK